MNRNMNQSMNCQRPGMARNMGNYSCMQGNRSEKGCGSAQEQRRDRCASMQDSDKSRQNMSCRSAQNVHCDGGCPSMQHSMRNMNYRQDRDQREMTDRRQEKDCREMMDRRQEKDCREMIDCRQEKDCREMMDRRQEKSCMEMMDRRQEKSSREMMDRRQEKSCGSAQKESCGNSCQKMQENKCDENRLNTVSDIIPTGSRHELLCFINEISFVVYDMLLYLDTHPGEQEALEYFRKNNRMREKALKIYSETYGPLTIATADDHCSRSWEWMEQPWPWELEGGAC